MVPFVSRAHGLVWVATGGHDEWLFFVYLVVGYPIFFFVLGLAIDTFTAIGKGPIVARIKRWARRDRDRRSALALAEIEMMAHSFAHSRESLAGSGERDSWNHYRAMVDESPERQSVNDNTQRAEAKLPSFLSIILWEQNRIVNGAYPDPELSVLAISSRDLRIKWYSAIRKTFRRALVFRLIAIVPVSAGLAAFGSAFFFVFGQVVGSVIATGLFILCLIIGWFPAQALTEAPVILIARTRTRAGYKLVHEGTTKRSMFTWITNGFAPIVKVDGIARAMLLPDGSFGNFADSGLGSERGVRPRLVKAIVPHVPCVFVCTTHGAIVDRIANLPRTSD